MTDLPDGWTTHVQHFTGSITEKAIWDRLDAARRREFDEHGSVCHLELAADHLARVSRLKEPEKPFRTPWDASLDWLTGIPVMEVDDVPDGEVWLVSHRPPRLREVPVEYLHSYLINDPDLTKAVRITGV